MPNSWETARGLNPSVANNNGVGPNGYTNLENYLNDLALVANWNVNGNGDWSSYANWVGSAPNAVDATATFGPVITSSRTVTLDAPRTIAQLNFDSSSGYTIGGSAALTMSVISGYATIDVVSGNHTIAAPLMLSNDLLVTVAGGSTLNVGNLQSSSKALTKSGAGTLVLDNVRAATLAVNGGVVQIARDGSNVATSKVTVISVAAGAKLDLTNNKFIAHQAVGTWNGSAYTGILGLVQSGYAGGTWQGSGIVTSETAAANPAVLTALAVATADQLGLSGGTFGGQSVSSGDTLVMYTWGGDANLDGTLNGDDYFAIDSHIGLAGSAFGYINGDFNYDGDINGDDYFIIDSNIGLGQSATPFPSSSAMPTVSVPAVPEPGATALCIAAIAYCGSARRIRVHRRAGA